MATTEEITYKKQFLLMELGERDAVSTAVAPNIDALWQAESGKGGDNIELQYFFVKRKAIDLLIGVLRREAACITDDETRRIMELRIKLLRDDRVDLQREIDSYISVFSFNLDIYEPSVG